MYPLIETLEGDDHAFVGAIAYGLGRIGGGNEEGQQATVYLDQPGYATFDSSAPAIIIVLRPDKMIVALHPVLKRL